MGYVSYTELRQNLKKQPGQGLRKSGAPGRDATERRTGRRDIAGGV